MKKIRPTRWTSALREATKSATDPRYAFIARAKDWFNRFQKEVRKALSSCLAAVCSIALFC